MAAASSLRRVDPRFVLPLVPRRAAVLGDLPGWREGLAAAGVESVPPDAAVDVVVASARLARAAAATGAATLLLEGAAPVGPLLRARGYVVRRLYALPRPGATQFVVDPAHRVAAAYAGRRLPRVGPAGRAAGALLGAGRALPGVPSLLVAVRPGASFVPAVLKDAERLGADPHAAWYLALGAGGVRKRGAFVLFPTDARRPAQVVKFTRRATDTAAFDADETGLRLAAQAGAAVAERAPRLVGRGVAGGVPASVETALAGAPLTRLAATAEGLRIADEVAAWLARVAVATATPPAALGPERERLTASGAAALVAGLPPVPGGFQHGDCWPDNVLVDGDQWGLVDWEHARGCGLPLADLLFFAAHALGADDPVRLFLGGSPQSRRLSAWVAAVVDAIGVPEAAVGTLAALAWHDFGARARASRLARERATGERVAPYLAERIADAWRSHPALGPGWRAWRP